MAILVSAAWIGALSGVRAETLVLKNGQTVEGTVIDATRNTVIIRRAIGGMRQMPLRGIEAIRIELARGNEITGEILSWVDGVYQVRSGDEVMRISDGNILSRAAVGTAKLAERLPSVPAEARPDNVAAARADHEDEAHQESAPTDAEIRAAALAGPDAEPTATAEAVTEQTVASTNTTAEIAAQQSDGQPVAVKASVKRAASGAPGMVFKIELSRPAEQTLVLIYGTLDGTAKAGIDYERQEGVILLAPGLKGAEVRVPLIKQPRSDGDTKFELFLMADPTVAEVVDQRITATIAGNNRLESANGSPGSG